jgi:hypothetical protein
VASRKRIDVSDLQEAADGLQRLVDAVRTRELTPSTATTAAPAAATTTAPASPELTPARRGLALRSVLGRRDGAARLQELDRDRRFLIPLDRQGTSFRYHRMVREVLLRELGVREGAAADDLHRRAATWFERLRGRHGAVEGLLRNPG